jgi:hypothetical protein
MNELAFIAPRGRQIDLRASRWNNQWERGGQVALDRSRSSLTIFDVDSASDPANDLDYCTECAALNTR